MGLKKLSSVHQDMVMDEVLFGYTRAEIQEKYSKHTSGLNNLHRIMNDPLAKEYSNELRRRKEERAFEKREEAESELLESLPKVAMELVRLSLKAKSENVRAKAGKDVMWMGGFKPVDEVEKREVPHLSVYDEKTRKKAEGE